MDHQSGNEKSSANAIVDDDPSNFIDKSIEPKQTREDTEDPEETDAKTRTYSNKHITKVFSTNDLHKRDFLANPSQTTFKNFAYYAVCRRRAAKKNRQITRQLNREIMHIAMMQSYALAGVKIDRIFSIGFPPEATYVPDFATIKERRRIDQLMYER